LGRATLEGFAVQENNHRSIGFEQSHSILIMRVSCFLSSLYNLSYSWIPYPFENMVASDHTFVKKNRVVCHWGACHRRLFNVHDYTFGYHVLPRAGRGYNNATR